MSTRAFIEPQRTPPQLQDSSQSLRAAMGITLKFIGFLVGLYILCIVIPDHFTRRAFNPTVWRSGDRYARSRMAEDLMTHHPLVGQSRQQAEMILGIPDSVGRTGTDEPVLIYEIQSARGNEGQFWVELDGKGMVRSTSATSNLVTWSPKLKIF